MSKCRQLSDENKELRNEIMQGKLPQAEAEAILHKQSRNEAMTCLQGFKIYLL